MDKMSIDCFPTRQNSPFGCTTISLKRGLKYVELFFFAYLNYIQYSTDILGREIMRNSKVELLENHCQDLLKQIGALPAFRQGTLASRFRKCGKPTCHCASDESLGHGPTWNITRKEHNQTISTYVKTKDVDLIQKQIDTFHQFQNLIHEYIETNIKLCDARLDTGKAAFREAEKKG